MRYTDDETAIGYRTIKIDPEDWAFIKTRRDLHKTLRTYHGMETGCDCSHCRNDWDCCGRMFPAHHEVTSFSRRTRSARIRTTYMRNV